MTAPAATLPTVIGRTENALRALLLKTLAGTPFAGYDAWVAISVVDRHAAPDTVDAVSVPLKIGHAEARQLLMSLVACGLLDSDDDGQSWTVSARGAKHLGAARSRVAAATARLAAGLPEADINAALRVLDHVQTRAEQELRERP